jgi:uncharacterized protein YkuJ
MKIEKNNEIDLSLVSIDNLIEEIFNRTELCAMVYSRFEDNGEPIIRISYSEGNNLQRVGLVEYLKSKCLDLMYNVEDNDEKDTL